MPARHGGSKRCGTRPEVRWG